MKAVATTFAARLRLARERRDMSQSDLARRAGLDPSAVSHYEADQRRPGADNIRDICRALDVTADYLLGLTDETRRLAQETSHG